MGTRMSTSRTGRGWRRKAHQKREQRRGKTKPTRANRPASQSRFTFSPPTNECKSSNGNTTDSSLNPFTIAAENGRKNALRASSSSTITYSFVPRRPKAKSNPRKVKKTQSNAAARNECYNKVLKKVKAQEKKMMFFRNHTGKKSVVTDNSGIAGAEASNGDQHASNKATNTPSITSRNARVAVSAAPARETLSRRCKRSMNLQRTVQTCLRWVYSNN